MNDFFGNLALFAALIALIVWAIWFCVEEPAGSSDFPKKPWEED